MTGQLWLAFILCSIASPVFAIEPIILFDGKTLNGWETSSGEPVSKGWKVEDGALRLTKEGDRGGNILTDREYGDFDLRFDWKISEGGNSGIKYRVREYPGKRLLGCEYQILGDDGTQLSKGSTGSLYDVYAPNNIQLNVGEYNHSRIVVSNNYVRHWLNGNLLLAAHFGSPDWFAKIAESKFKDVEGFGLNQFGKIMLTDHNSEVWYKNIYLYDLTPTSYVCRPTVSSRAFIGHHHKPRYFRRFRWRRCR